MGQGTAVRAEGATLGDLGRRYDVGKSTISRVAA
jgi:hypothetical protein